MKKTILITLFLIFICNFSLAEENYNWNKETQEKKIHKLGRKIMQSNHLYEHISFNIGKIEYLAWPKVPKQLYKNDDVLIPKQILNYIDSDDELAGILSHEIAYYVNSHFMRQRKKFLCIYPLYYAESYFTMAFNPITNVIINYWTKNDEYELDITGVDLMVQAGYDPYAMLTIFNKITNNPEKINYSSCDKPLFKNRIALIQSYIKEKYPQFNNSKFKKIFNEDSVLSDYKTTKKPKISPAPIENYFMFMSPAETL